MREGVAYFVSRIAYFVLRKCMVEEDDFRQDFCSPRD